MGKDTKRERQKLNKMVKDLERKKIEKRKKNIKAFTILGVILILPLTIILAKVINSATTPPSYSAKITLSIEEKEIGTIEVKLDEPNAQKSVKRFIEYASNGTYNGKEFYSAVKDRSISAGAQNADGTGSLGNSLQVEGPPRKFESGDLIWDLEATSQQPKLSGSSFSIITASSKSASLAENGFFNRQTPASAEQKASYIFGYIGYINKAKDIEIARKIEALAPEQEVDPATGKAKLDEQGNEIPAAIKPLKVAKIVRISVFKDGKEIRPGEYKDNTATTTTTTTTSVPSS
jgi:cyclophilin family peptidyl-prolyl cis-trans isomerase